MTVNDKEETYLDSIFQTLKENNTFFETNPVGKEIHTEIVELINDSIDLLPIISDFSTPKTPFVLNGLQPFSYGIFLSLYTGNIPVCFMQLRLLVEYLALTVLAGKLNGGTMLEKLDKTRVRYSQKPLSNMITDFDSGAYDLWKKLSEWLHARTYSKKIEDIVISQGVKTWSIIQPAPYHEDDEEDLQELLHNIKIFRDLLKKILTPR